MSIRQAVISRAAQRGHFYGQIERTYDTLDLDEVRVFLEDNEYIRLDRGPSRKHDICRMAEKRLSRTGLILPLHL